MAPNLARTGIQISKESKKQQIMAFSSTEAEYMTTSQATEETLFLIKGLPELYANMQTPVTRILNCDNVGAIENGKITGISPQTKHIQIRLLFLRDLLVEDRRIQLRYVSTKNMLANILTKALGRINHQRIAEIIN